MDGLDLFRKLGTGAKFNFKRFRNDAERLKACVKRLVNGGGNIETYIAKKCINVVLVVGDNMYFLLLYKLSLV